MEAYGRGKKITLKIRITFKTVLLSYYILFLVSLMAMFIN